MISLRPHRDDEDASPQHASAINDQLAPVGAPPAPGGMLAAALIGTAPLGPIWAGLIAVVAATSSLPPLPALRLVPDPWPDFLSQPLVASASGLALAWLCLAAVYRLFGLGTAERADARSYDSFSARADQLRARWAAIKRLRPAAAASIDDGDEATAGLLAAGEIAERLRSLAADRQARDARWVLGHGYIRLWRTLNRAEEALLEVAPTHLVLAEAAFDRLRLEGSNMQHAETLLALLDRAVAVLRRPASDAPEPGARAEARCVVRHVRHAINDFRLDRWLGLLQARNRLLASIVFTSFTVYVLLWLSIAAHAAPGAIVAATSFYFVGATVGLFNRLYADAAAGASAAGSDYGLGTTRLIGVPLLSGVAAVLGVLFTSTLAVAQAHGTDALTMQEAFDFINHPLNILTAAVFGLTPGLVLERLKQQAQAYKDDLKSTEADTLQQPAKALSGR